MSVYPHRPSTASSRSTATRRHTPTVTHVTPRSPEDRQMQAWIHQCLRIQDARSTLSAALRRPSSASVAASTHDGYMEALEEKCSYLEHALATAQSAYSAPSVAVSSDSSLLKSLKAHLQCPITLSVPSVENAVFTRSGHVFDKAALGHVYHTTRKHPLTREPLERSDFRPPSLAEKALLQMCAS